MTQITQITQMTQITQIAQITQITLIAQITQIVIQFSRSGVEEVDEREIFMGSENKLTMRQTYTHKFQCLYRLHEYPFDAQVT